MLIYHFGFHKEITNESAHKETKDEHVQKENTDVDANEIQDAHEEIKDIPFEPEFYFKNTTGMGDNMIAPWEEKQLRPLTYFPLNSFGASNSEAECVSMVKNPNNKLICLNKKKDKVNTNFYIRGRVSKDNGKFLEIETCGGIPMMDGYCARPLSYMFSKKQKIPLKNERTNLCRTIPKATDIKYLDENNDKDNRHQPTIFPPRAKDCNLISNNVASLIKKFKNKRLAFIGDSHIRNMFEGLICWIRNSSLCVDMKISNGFYYYGFNSNKDKFINLRNDIEFMKLDLDTNEFDVQALFFWWPQWDSLDLKLLEKLNPDYILISVAGHEKSIHNAPQWRKQLDLYMDGPKSKVKKFIFAEWPWGHDSKEKKKWITRWMQNNTKSEMMEYFPMNNIYQHYRGNQLETTWHSLCQITNKHIHAEELCTGMIERVSSNVVLTLFHTSNH